MSRFDACLPITLVFEGGYSNNPKDPGGATYKGVTQKTYDAYRQRKGDPTQDVRSITDDELHTLYKEEYWDQVNGDILPVGLDLAVFDYAVNSGVEHAAKALQSLVGARADGVIASQTIEAVKKAGAVDQLVVKYCNARLAFLKTLSTWKTFGDGWTTRIKGSDPQDTRLDHGIEDYAFYAALDASAMLPPPVTPAAPQGKALPSDVSIIRKPAGAGAISVAAGVAGQQVMAAAQQVQPHIANNLFGHLALGGFVLLSVVGGGLIAFSWYRKMKDTGLTFKELFT